MTARRRTQSPLDSDACTLGPTRSVVLVGACSREPLSEPRAVHSMPSEDAASGVSLARGGGRLLLVFVEEVIDLGVISDRHLREHTPISRRSRLLFIPDRARLVGAEEASVFRRALEEPLALDRPVVLADRLVVLNAHQPYAETVNKGARLPRAEGCARGWMPWAGPRRATSVVLLFRNEGAPSIPRRWRVSCRRTARYRACRPG